MGTGTRLAGTVVAVTAVFAVAWGVGASTAPRPAPPPAVPSAPTPPAAAPAPAPPESRVALVDGYRVRLDGELVPGGPSQVFATITRDGAAVTDLEPHLGGFGHLVVLRLEDLALLPVRSGGPAPAPTDRSGPGLAFTTGSTAPGTYRLYLEFRHAGAVRTATFAVSAREVS
ncbi:hypothetical protein [Pseudonocardia kunmingensis]|uniref:Secreted protein n=1 Tax=Pseudonocardia kunmingensis TaxID=630975 RepID=A0A543CYU2_9PSEU|nr:hypothetical protein [Pseudonocardia kunmingensis]TQM02272.1 hypothetical protein FB558_8138 [Pseudonocardia kunmingensis]